MPKLQVIMRVCFCYELMRSMKKQNHLYKLDIYIFCLIEIQNIVLTIVTKLTCP